MDWDVCRNTLKKPIGPTIGFFCQFLIMPLVNLCFVLIRNSISNRRSYILPDLLSFTFPVTLISFNFQLSFVLGYILFPGQPELQIGMFFTGISPSGGASNIWTVLLEGNLNLSVTMTTLCTIAAFGERYIYIYIYVTWNNCTYSLLCVSHERYYCSP